MADTFDLVILGTGNAGMGAAGVFEKAGKSVAMVESWDVGGTCPLRGCVPKKVLVAAAQVLHQIDLAEQHHIKVGKPKLDWAQLIEREQGFVEGVADWFASDLEKRGIKLFRGKAKFNGETSIEVDGATLDAGKVLIATGSKPRTLGLDGEEHMITSDDILTMTALPESLIFVGGGVIALEFSHVLARAGCAVTILEVTERLLPNMDAEVVEKMHEECERIGITIHTGVEVTGVAEKGNSLTVTYKKDGKENTIAAERVANGAGRVPAVDDLDLGAAGIDHDGIRIKTNAYLQNTSNDDVYVAGDALTASAQLSPVATYEGRIAGNNMLNGNSQTPEYLHIPANVYTVPALGSVGHTEAGAKEKGLSFDVKTNDMTGWRSSKTHAESVAFSKVLVEKESDRILGAHILGHGGEEIVHLFAMAMKHGLTAKELNQTVYGYPTFASDVKFMV